MKKEEKENEMLNIKMQSILTGSTIMCSSGTAELSSYYPFSTLIF